MKGLEQIIKYFVDSSLWVALSVLSLTLITYKHLNLTINHNVLLLNFFGTVVGYNFIKNFNYFSRAKVNEKFVKVVSLISLIVSLYNVFQISIKSILVLSIAFLVTFFYAGPFIKKNLRSIKGLKIYLIALSWALVTVIFPCVESDLHYDRFMVIEFFQRVIFVLVITLPFEIRDYKRDEKALGTIPQQIGVVKTKLLAYILLLVLLLLEVFKLSSNSIEMLLLGCLIVLFVYKSKVEQSKFYASFWVEGIPIYWLCIIESCSILSKMHL